MKVEILAPAGSMEHLRLAVYGGADGIYLGTKEFSARQSAANFSLSELREGVEFCHGRGVNVYVAVNTLVKNSELDGVISLAKELGRINVDGVIVQDLAVAEIFRNVCPKMPLHASTQMAIHNLSGAELLRDMGFSRVVLARELTLNEIKEITAKCGIETEVFVHGAHCMSASGMCYLSSFIGGRSGNRGRCAQPCRLDFKIDKGNYCLSLKDMCYVDYVKALEDAGVASLKIEGRMKRPEYAYIASKTYKQSLNGEKTDVELLRKIFSRSGFTDGYIKGKRTKDMFGYRKKEDVEDASEAIKSIGKVEEPKKIPLYAKIEVCDGQPFRVTFSAENKSVCVESEEIITDKTLLPQLCRIESALKKTGGTPFDMESIESHIYLPQVETEKAFPISALNAMRREGLEKLLYSISQREHKEITDYVIPSFKTRKNGETEYRIRVEKWDQTGDFDGTVIIPYTEAHKISDKDKSRFVLELPILVYPDDEEKIIKSFEALRKQGFTKAQCENIAFVSKLKNIGFEVCAGAYMNITNSMSLLELEKLGVKDVTLSVEINSGDIHAFGSSGKVGIVAYGKMPLMQFRNCPVRANIGCEKCGGNGKIKDRLSKEFSVLCKDKKYVSLLNTVPLSLSGKTFPVDFQTLYFTKETPFEVKKIISQFLSGVDPDYPHTKGLYFRKVL